MLENCKRLICSPSLNKVYCTVLYCIVNQSRKGCPAPHTSSVHSAPAFFPSFANNTKHENGGTMYDKILIN